MFLIQENETRIGVNRMYPKILTPSDFVIIEAALEAAASDKECPIQDKAQRLFNLFTTAKDIQIVLLMEEQDGGEQRMLDAMEAAIYRGETSYGDD